MSTDYVDEAGNEERSAPLQVETRSRTQLQYDMSLKQGDHSTVFWPSSDGSNYRGEWLNDRKHGYGVQIYKGGSAKYEGQYLNGKREGEGVFWIIDGKKMRKSYIGLWKSDQRHGKGTAFYPGGECYQGQWENNKRHGEGQMRFKDGSSYSGNWYGNERSGYGHLQKANGDTYEGYWVRGKREGQGSYFYGTSGKVFVGEWGNDQPVAGIYQQAVKNPAEPGQMPVTSILPEVKLEQPDAVIQESLDSVRQGRLLYRAIHTPLEKLYSGEELTQLEEIYFANNSGEFGDFANFRLMLTMIDIDMEETELKDLIQSFFLYKELGSLSLRHESENLQANLQQIELTFENFAKIVAIIVDQESRR